MAGVLGRLVGQVHGGRRFVGAWFGARQLRHRHKEVDARLQGDYRALGEAALEADACTGLKHHGRAAACRDAAETASKQLATARAAMQAAQDELRAQAQTNEKIIAGARANYRQAIAAADRAAGELSRSRKRCEQLANSARRCAGKLKEASDGSKPMPPEQWARLTGALEAETKRIESELSNIQQTLPAMETASAEKRESADEAARVLRDAEQNWAQIRRECEGRLKATEERLITAESASRDAAQKHTDALIALGSEAYAARLLGGNAAAVRADACLRDLAEIEAAMKQRVGEMDANRRAFRRTAGAGGGLVAAVIVVGAALLIRGGEGERTAQVAAKAWPNISMEKVIDPAAGGTVEHESGVKVEVKPGTFGRATRLKVESQSPTIASASTAVPCGPVIRLKTDAPTTRPGELFANPVKVTIPYDAPPGKPLAVGCLVDGEWRKIGGRVDAAKRTVSFDTLSFSDYTVVVDDWADWPDVFITDVDDPMRTVKQIPRGAVFQLNIVLPGRVAGTTVEGQFSPHGAVGQGPVAILMAPDAKRFTAFDKKGTARLFTRDDRTTLVTFLVRVPETAALGIYDLNLLMPSSTREAVKWPESIASAIEVTNRKVFIVDIDGLRGDIFRGIMLSKIRPPNLGMIFGATRAVAKTKFESDDLVRAEDLALKGNIAAHRYPHGYIVDGATTIFPSYTFAGHAAIFTGKSPGEYAFPGNEWFDRRPRSGMPRRYAFTGAFAGEAAFGLGLIAGRAQAADPFFSYWATGQANGLIRTDMVYDEVADPAMGLQLKSVVGLCMYYGHTMDVKHIWAGTWTQGISYTASNTGMNFDKEMVRVVRSALAARPTAGGTAVLDCLEMPLNRINDPIFLSMSPEDLRRVGLVTLFFASVDHACHNGAGGTSVDRIQWDMMLDWIDPLIGQLLKSVDNVNRQNSLWVVTSDHGHTVVKQTVRPDLRDDLMKEQRVEAQWFIATDRGGSPAGDLQQPTLVRRQAWESDFVVSYNGGAAYLYIRSKDPQKTPGWDALPANGQVIEWGKKLRDFARDPQIWKGKVDLVLVRLPANAARANLGVTDPPEFLAAPGGNDPRALRYYALDPADGPDAPIVPLAQYLMRPAHKGDGERPAGTCVLYDKCYEWGPADKQFLEEVLQGMNCDRAGDVVALPHLPDYYFETSAVKLTNHGSILRSDMDCTLAVANMGVDTSKDPRLKNLLEDSIDLKRNGKASNRDVRRIVVNWYKERPQFDIVPMQQGPLAVTLSVAEDRRNTRITIASDEMTKLSGTKGLRIRVYRGDTAAGPFKEIDTQADIFANTPIYPPPSSVSSLVRIAKNVCETVRLTDSYSGDRRLSYYRVTIQPIDSRTPDRATGPEMTSDIIKPKEAMLVRFPMKVQDEAVLKIPSNRSAPTWYEVGTPPVVLADEGFEVPDAHFKVTTDDGWVGHYWGGRWSGTGKDARFIFATQGIKLPGKASGVAALYEVDGANILGGGERLKCRVRVKVPADEEWAKLAAERAPRLREALVRDLANLQKSATEQRTKLKEVQDDLARRQADTKSPPKASDVILSREQIGLRQCSLDQTLRVEIPAVQHRADRELAALAGNYAKALEAALKEAEIPAVQREIDIARQSLFIRTSEDLMACADASPNQKERAKEVRASAEKGKKWAGDTYIRALERALDDVAEMAMPAGDVGALTTARAKTVAGALQLGDKMMAAARLDRLAWETAILTGDREKAAEYLAQSWQLQLEVAGAKAADVRRSVEAASPPTWWPPARPWKLPEGRLDLNQLQQTMQKLTE